MTLQADRRPNTKQGVAPALRSGARESYHSIPGLKTGSAERRKRPLL